MLAITQVGAAGDIPDSPEVVPAAADGAKSIMKAKVTRVHEEKSLVHLLPDVGDSCGEPEILYRTLAHATFVSWILLS